MLAVFIIFAVSLLCKFGTDWLAKDYSFFVSVQPWTNGLMYFMAVVFAIVAIAHLIKSFRK